MPLLIRRLSLLALLLLFGSLLYLHCEQIFERWGLQTQALLYYLSFPMLGLLATMTTWSAEPKSRFWIIWHLVKSLLLVPIGCFLAIGLAQLAQHRLTRQRSRQLIVALDKYHARHHHYPDALRQLMPAQFDHVPTTALGLFRANPFYYQLIISDSEHKRPYYQLTYFYPKVTYQYNSATREWQVEDEED
ncbi:hypothetical protein Q5H93_03815 [Hymenobacter sp. ASUV-10]|uniref:Uncharacterized protein n=1 Tax=Hymenobacter aranciens TaxID=3063996 RepID=A0ABT9B6F7_9BACT|nr:hypothetical protein [Hymenobacter sp. ASUV-10]MDO7873847.1 hypothetical protein [Hymenobacter sp. ASUV-10]